jgi:MbtH protein
MIRFRDLALSLAVTVMAGACTPSAGLLTGNVPMPAASGSLKVVDSANAAEPPTLVLETPTRSSEDREDNTIYNVVVNVEEQYSLWPAHRELAPGWKNAGFSGRKDECLAYIQKVWTDMRPLSLRKKMDEMAKQQQQQKV